ncbi:MAG: MarR family transcriptional regulator [Candidatus Sumerlaeaceae bacterium]
MYEVLPPEVREFALRYLDSVAQLEALLLMRREPAVTWTVPELAKRLYIDQAGATGILEILQKRQLVTFTREQSGTPTYKYAPAAQELEQLVVATEAAYSQYLIPLTQLLHSKPSTAAHHFADAFRFREKK